MIVINLVALFNFYIDPLRMFSHKHELNSRQLDFNERQQKTNYLKFVNNDFDSILLGSSRTTYIDQNLFEDMKVFNYAANALKMYEFKQFIGYAKKLTGNVKTIVLGLDFLGSNRLSNGILTDDNYLKIAEGKFYRFKTLYSSRLLEYAWKNTKLLTNPTRAYYSRDNVKHEPPNFKITDVAKLKKKMLTEEYEYDENLASYFYGLKAENPDTKFIVFTTPVTTFQLDAYHEQGVLKYYYQWLRDLVEVFDEVHHFNYPNEVTGNIDNFFDATHMKSHVGVKITSYLAGNSLKEDFGITLNKQNIDSFIQTYEAKHYNAQ